MHLVGGLACYAVIDARDCDWLRMLLVCYCEDCHSCMYVVEGEEENAEFSQAGTFPVPLILPFWDDVILSLATGG
jgi:hypothetical protein